MDGKSGSLGRVTTASQEHTKLTGHSSSTKRTGEIISRRTDSLNCSAKAKNNLKT